MSQCKVFETGVMESLTGNVIRPGGLEITKEAMELCEFTEGAKILDVGCGNGASLEYIEKKYQVNGLGIDKSALLINQGKERNPELNIQEGDGEFLEFPSHTFDGVMMECVLSLINNQMEALHEAYCVTKKGGKLIISDLFLKDPDPQEVLAAQREAILARNKQYESGECETVQQRIPSESCINGAFVKEALLETLRNAGFEVLLWQDKTSSLLSFVAEAVFQYGSMEEFWAKILPEASDPKDFCKTMSQAKLGYFLLVAQKPK